MFESAILASAPISHSSLPAIGRHLTHTYMPPIHQVVPLRHVHPKYLFGSGKADEMSGVVSSVDADAVFVNAPLSGNQQKALSKKWDGTTILDRFRVILDIFADRARTTEAKLQVTFCATQAFPMIGTSYLPHSRRSPSTPLYLVPLPKPIRSPSVLF